MPACSIAIVGMACRLPDAADLPTLWQNLLDKKSSFRDIGSARWDPDAFFSTNPRAVNCTNCRRAALLENVEWFAGRALGIAPRRATVMDPQQRIMLELAAEALQDSGLETESYAREHTGTFVGASVCEYASLLTAALRWTQLNGGQFGEVPAANPGLEPVARLPTVRSYTVPGSLISMSASCVAQALDLRGPALTVDAACASSAASIIQAVQYLQGLGPRDGAAPVALAGGVYLLLLPDNFVGFSKIGALASEECRPFDAGASGFLFGEGGAMVVLKRLQDAVSDGDRIYAVLRSTAWSNDGRSDSPMTPQVAGQLAALRQALVDAALPPEELGYVECHGTGTPVGDRTELLALGLALGARPEPLWLGSIKANIGHALSAAGAAGLLRAALAVYHGRIPPQAAWERWHPDLEDLSAKFRLPVEPVPWSARPRSAMVNAFGFGGTNCSLLLQSWDRDPPPGDLDREVPVCCSADSRELLLSYLRSVRSSLRAGSPFPAVAYTVTAARRLRSEAALFMAGDSQQALSKLDELLAGSPPAGTFLGPSNLLAEAPDANAQAGRRIATGSARDLFPPSHRRIVTLAPVPVARERYWLTPER